MKRILFFMHTTSQIGGVETWLDRAHDHLAANGFEPTVGLVRGLKYNDPTRYKMHHPHIRTVEVDGRGLNRDGRVRALIRCIRKVNPAIVFPLGIVDAHEAVIRCKRSGQDVRLLARTQGNLAPMLADLATYRDWIDLAICPGRLTRKMLVDWAGFAPERVLNIPNGADPATVLQVPAAAGAPLRVGYVGRMTRIDKRPQDLIDLYRELESRCVAYTLDIVGDGPCLGEIREALGAYAPKVRIHGAARHEELYQRVFPNLDVLIMPSSTEAFTIVLVEAMIHGVVPVSSHYDGFHAEGMVSDGVNGLSFPVGDMSKAADHIAVLAMDRAMLARMSKASLARAADFTLSRCMERWVGALKTLSQEPVVRGTEVPSVPGPSKSGLLDRLGVPGVVSDGIRRVRRFLVGPAITAGGEEWPLHYRHHDDARLSSARQAIASLDVPDSVIEAPPTVATTVSV